MSSSAKGLAGRYAGALYALAEEAGKVDAVVADMTGLAELVSGNDEMKTLVGSWETSTTDQPFQLLNNFELAGMKPVK